VRRARAKQRLDGDHRPAWCGRIRRTAHGALSQRACIFRRVRASPIIVDDNELGALNAFDGSKERDEHGSVGDVPLLHGDDDDLWR